MLIAINNVCSTVVHFDGAQLSRRSATYYMVRILSLGEEHLSNKILYCIDSPQFRTMYYNVFRTTGAVCVILRMYGKIITRLNCSLQKYRQYRSLTL